MAQNKFRVWLENYLQRTGNTVNKGKFAEHVGLKSSFLANLQADPENSSNYRKISPAHCEKIIEGLKKTDFPLNPEEEENLKEICGSKISKADEHAIISASNINYIPNILTGRFDQLYDFQELFYNNPETIYEIVGGYGDGRDHFTKIIINWLQNTNSIKTKYRTKLNKHIRVIDFTGLWDRYGDEEISVSMSQLENDIFDYILVEMEISSPRSHSDTQNSDIVDYSHLTGYIENVKAENSSNFFVLSFLSLWPHGQSSPNLQNQIIDILNKLYKKLIQINGVCIISSSSKPIIPNNTINSTIIRLKSLDYDQLTNMRHRLFPGSEDAMNFIKSNFPNIDKDKGYEYSIDSWALSIGNDKPIEKYDQYSLKPEFQFPKVYEGDKTDFDLGAKDAVKFEQTIDEYFNISDQDVQVRDFIRDNTGNIDSLDDFSAVNSSYFNFINIEENYSDRHTKSLLCILVLFNSSFSTGDVLRILKFTDDSDWWENPGTVRDYLQFLTSKGWLQVEFIPGKIDFSYRFRLSVRSHFISLIKKNKLLHEKTGHYKIAFCKGIIDELTTLTYRGLNFEGQATEIHNRLPILYAAHMYAKEQHDSQLMLDILKIICQYYSCNAYWHLAAYLTREFIKTESQKENSHALIDAEIMLMYFNFNKDSYDVPGKYFDARNVDPVFKTYSLSSILDSNPLHRSKIHLLLARLTNVSVNKNSSELDRLTIAKNHLLLAFKDACIILDNTIYEKKLLFNESRKDKSKPNKKSMLILHYKIIDLLQQIASIKYWAARLEIQQNTEWLHSKKDLDSAISNFNNVIDFCARHHFYRELVLSYIWLVRLDLLHDIDEVNRDSPTRLSLPSIVMASSYSTSTPDRKVQNMLVFHKEWIQYREKRSDKATFRNVFENIDAQYRFMGEQYWAIFNKLIFSREVVRDSTDDTEYLEFALKQLMICFRWWEKSWEDNQMTDFKADFKLTPSRLFIEIARDILSRLRGIESLQNEIAAEKSLIDFFETTFL